MIDHRVSPILVTPDTNVLVSGGTITLGASAQIINTWRAGTIDFALSPTILEEVTDVLSRPFFIKKAGWTRKTIIKYVGELADGSYIFPGTLPVSIAMDPDDNMIFATAVEAGADYIVSGDKKHVIPIKEFKGIKVVSPKEFVDKVLKTRKTA